MARSELRRGQAAQEPFLAGLVLLVRVSLIWGMGYTAHTLTTEMHPGH